MDTLSLLALGKTALIGIGAGAAVVLIALLVGVCKGFRRVGKGVFYWFVVGGSFIAAHILFAEKNPLEKSFTGGLAGYKNVVWLLILFTACILIGLIVLGVCKLLFRPVENDVKGYRSLYDDDFEAEELELTARNRRRDRKARRRDLAMEGEGENKVGFFSRVFGGLLCVLSLVVVLAAIAGVALVVMKETKWGNTLLGSVFELPVMETIMQYLSTYAFDFIAAGVVFGMVLWGYRRGFLGALRMLFKRFGVLLAVGAGFALPFIGKFNSIGFIQSLLTKCSALVAKLSPMLASVGGKILLGIVLAIVFAIAAALLNLLLKSLVRGVENSSVLCVVDGVFGCIVYLALGALAIAGIGALLYLLQAFGAYNTSRLFEDGTFVGELYNVAEIIMGRLLAK